MPPMAQCDQVTTNILAEVRELVSQKASKYLPP